MAHGHTEVVIVTALRTLQAGWLVGRAIYVIPSKYRRLIELWLVYGQFITINHVLMKI